MFFLGEFTVGEHDLLFNLPRLSFCTLRGGINSVPTIVTNIYAMIL